MNPDNVMARRFAPVQQRYDWRENALYALSLGFGDKLLDEIERRYVVEGAAQLVVPSYCVTLAWPPFWHRDPDTGIDWVHALHGEQHFQLHRPLPLEAAVSATHRIVGVQDKGLGRGALVHVHTELHSAASGVHLASLQSVQFLRGDGGCGARGESRPPLPMLPADESPSAVRDYPTQPQAALLSECSHRFHLDRFSSHH